jgi:hypothetical protein
MLTYFCAEGLKRSVIDWRGRGTAWRDASTRFGIDYERQVARQESGSSIRGPLEGCLSVFSP